MAAAVQAAVGEPDHLEAEARSPAEGSLAGTREAGIDQESQTAAEANQATLDQGMASPAFQAYRAYAFRASAFRA